jgi:hypothetical protein
MANPFKPTFGVAPPLLVGRGELLELFEEALEEGPGAPARATIYTGARGTGKTVMLTAVEKLARNRGWLVISETATPGFLSRIVSEHLPAKLADQDPDDVKRRMTGVAAPLNAGGVTWATTERHQPVMGLRSQLDLLTDLLAEHGTGLLITLDEIHIQPRDELRELTSTIQHAFREEREVAFVGAGLPSALSDVLNDEVLTFVRRADRHLLGAVSLGDVKRALREPIEVKGRAIAEPELETAADATHGYPFLVQLIGYHVWRQHPARFEIEPGDVDRGIAAARRRMGSLVHEPALKDLSAVDRTFLLAMARDDGPARMSDIAQRMGVDANYASQYRLRLITAEVIEQAEYGTVDFALPYLREYLRDHAAAQVEIAPPVAGDSGS